MHKQGEIILVYALISFVIVAGSMLAGTYLINDKEVTPNDMGQTYSYIGNFDENKFYDFACMIYIEEGQRILFKDYSQAIDLEFEYTPECPK